MQRFVVVVVVVVALASACGPTYKMSSLEAQRQVILAENDPNSRLGKLDAKLSPLSAKSAIAATERFSAQFLGVVENDLCFGHKVVQTSASKLATGSNALRYQRELDSTMVVVQAHDALDAKTTWERRAKSDLRSVARIGKNIVEKTHSSLTNADGTPRTHYETTVSYELCTAMPVIGPNTQYITLRMAPNTDGQQLFVWKIERGEAASSDDSDGAPDEPAPTFVAPANAPTVMAALAAAGTYTTLVTALAGTGVEADLADEGPFTVLAATDDAFAKLPANRRVRLLGNKDKLAEYLREHIIVGAYPPDAVPERLEVRTLAGKKLRLAKNRKRFLMGHFEVSTPIKASNAVIYAVDTVVD